MPPAEASERFSRQVILPSVGPEGQKKWSEASTLLAGEGPALGAAVTALASTGVSKFYLLSDTDFNPQPLAAQFPGASLEVLAGDSAPFPETSVALILTANKEIRRNLSRHFRSQGKPALFAWAAGSGFAVAALRHGNGKCPCLECFEVMNPKAFSPLRHPIMLSELRGTGGSGGQATDEKTLERMMGAMAASEALQWILKDGSPLEGKVWITSLETGVSLHHEIHPSYKCPALMLEEGATVTP